MFLCFYYGEILCSKQDEFIVVDWTTIHLKANEIIAAVATIYRSQCLDAHGRELYSQLSTWSLCGLGWILTMYQMMEVLFVPKPIDGVYVAK